MLYLFGLHCGSWVRHAAALSFVRHIHVIGISSPDIGFAHAWENCLIPFMRRKLWYWSVGQNANWLKLFRRGDHSRSFDSASALISAFMPVLQESPAVYLSIDKDVLSRSIVCTGWDQGVFEPKHLEAVLQACSGKLVGTDITGDISVYGYAGRLKKILSRLDGRKPQDTAALESWQAEQRAVNIRLLDSFPQKGLPCSR